jgi:hypothetical protein
MYRLTPGHPGLRDLLTSPGSTRTSLWAVFQREELLALRALSVLRVLYKGAMAGG